MDTKSGQFQQRATTVIYGMPMRDLRELGVRPRRRNPYPPATLEQIAEFERYFGVKLREDYVQFLKFANGGRPILREYDDPRGGAGEVNDFYGLGSREADTSIANAEAGAWDYGNLWGETRVRRPWIGAHGVPFARDGGDNQLFFDYTVNPPVVSRLNSSTRQTFQIAKDFSSLLDLLRPPRE